MFYDNTSYFEDNLPSKALGNTLIKQGVGLDYLSTFSFHDIIL